MSLKQGKWRVGRILLLMVIIAAIGLAGFGCIQGMQPLGWSGGAVSDGTLFVGSKEGKLVAVNLADESRQWSEAIKAPRGAGGLFGCPQTYGGGCGGQTTEVAIYGTPALAEDLVYTGSYIRGNKGKVYAFAVPALSIRWDYPRDDYLEPIVGGLVAAQGNVYFGCSDGKVYALDAATGDRQWEFATEDKIWSTPAVSDDALFIGSFDKKLHALNIYDGTEKWAFETEGAIVSTPLVHNGTVYVGSFDRHLYAINAADGSLKWKFMGGNWFWAMPIVYGNTVYAGCLDGKVYALNTDTGDKVTEFELGSPASSSPVLADGSIIFASRKGVVYTVDTALNTIKQLADIDELVYGPLCISDGVVYIHTQDLTLHRINATTGAVLRSISLKSKD